MAKVKIQGNASGTGVITLVAPNTNTDRTVTLPDEDITLGGGVDGIVSTADATAITIDSNENVGIGETSPFTRLHIKEGDSGATDVWGNTGLVIENSSDSRLTLLSGAASIGSIKFGDSGLNRQGGIDYNHNGDAMTFATVNTERLKLTSDGRGLSQFTAKAWVSFNGTGTVAINDSHNVSSITDNGTGDYTVNFSNSLANGNYSISVSGRENNGTGGHFCQAPHVDSPATGSFRMGQFNNTFALRDSYHAMAIVFGD